MSIAGLTIIGERINPGFRSTQALFEKEDLAAIQALAVRQASQGARFLNVNAGTKALNDPGFMVEIVRAIQAVVDVPLSLDCPDFDVLKAVLEAYDPARAHGEKPIINSISESRWQLAELLKVRPCRAVLMSSEQVCDGRMMPNRTGAEVHGAARRMALRLVGEYGVRNEDLFVDVSIATLAADTEGLIQMALDGTRLVRQDPALAGIHIMGGLSNLPQHLPKTASDGSDLHLQIECAFLTVAMPLGFDTVLGTPWRAYRLLPTDNRVLREFARIVALRDSEALMAVVELYQSE
ncbi:MAG: 5-methyltetrahydrofolate:corrinoid/iron-sulfur protein co-methyltransferase [Burkholderiaceae bacterium]|nr:5-methyltetrahydrofolate:corrinoid/iron-sulfur protein co-methyltransferase [Burkholderiaceae bacterium]